MSGGRDWTRNEENQAMSLSLTGLKHAAIAKRLSRTTRAVAHKIRALRRRHGLSLPDPRQHASGQLSEAVCRLCIPGVADVAVADILGVSRHTVAKCRKRLGIPPGMPQHVNTKRIVPEPTPHGGIAAKVVRLYGQLGMNDRELARRIGCSQPGVYRARTKLGLPAAGYGGRKRESEL